MSDTIHTWDLAKQPMLVVSVTHWTLHTVLWAFLFCPGLYTLRLVWADLFHATVLEAAFAGEINSI